MGSSTQEELPSSITQQRQPIIQNNILPNGNISQQLSPQSAPKARLQCHNCQRLLEYDAGAQYVQCFGCGAMNAVQPNSQAGGQVLSMLCAICHTTNLAPYGINYVRCGNCSTISQVSHAYRQNRMMNSPQQMPMANLPENICQAPPLQLELGVNEAPNENIVVQQEPSTAIEQQPPAQQSPPQSVTEESLNNYQQPPNKLVDEL